MLRPLIALLLLIPPAGSSVTTSTRAQATELDLANARGALNALARSMEKVERLRADYTQEQESLLLAEPIESKGTLHLRAKPACLLLELGGDHPVQVRSDERTHQMYWPKEQKAERWLFRSNELARTLLRLFSPEVARIEEAFVIRAYVREAGKSRLTLVPKNEELHRFLTSLTLTIDESKPALIGVAHENAEGEEVRFELSNIDLAPDAEQENALFDRPLPKEVRLLVHEVSQAPPK